MPAEAFVARQAWIERGEPQLLEALPLGTTSVPVRLDHGPGANMSDTGDQAARCFSSAFLQRISGTVH